MKNILRTFITLVIASISPIASFTAGEEVKQIDFFASQTGTMRTSCENTGGLPPVGDQVVAGSCYAWAAAYYYLTYVQWQEYGWDVSDPAHQCSPAFVYNLTNGGVDNGASTGEYARRDAFQVFETMGCATMADMPYAYSGYLTFPSEAAFRNGMRFRTQSTHFIDTDTPEGIQALKDHLLEGNIAVLGIFGYANLDNINLYGHAYCVSQTYGSRLYWHEVTVIGFEDSLETADGVGAFRFVNSLGDRWGDHGFFWMSYEAVMDPKTASGYAMYATDRIGYEPSLAARIEVDHSDRYNLIYAAGIGEPESPDTSLLFFDFNPMSLMIGVPYPEGAIVLDLTDLTGFFEFDQSNQFFVTVTDNGSYNGFSGSLMSLAIEDLNRGLSALSQDTPLPLPDYAYGITATVVFDDTFSPPGQLSAQLDTLLGTVSLSWEPSVNLSNFIRYRLYRDGELVDSTTMTSYTDTLTRHGYHHYGVSALFLNGESLQSIIGIFWPFPYGLPYVDGFEYGLGGWEQVGTSGIEASIIEDPIYEGQCAVAMQTNLTDNTIIGRGFDPIEGVDIEVWFNMESCPDYDLGFGGCIAIGTPTGENLGMFTEHEGHFAFVEVTNQQGLEIEIFDSTFVLELNTWYKHKIQYCNGRFYAMLLDEQWNVLVNDLVYVRDFLVNQVILVAWGLDQGWNYFDAFSIREWNGFDVRHFSPVDPTSEPYAIIVTEAFLGDSVLVAGDEIAVYNRDLCVGAVEVDGHWPLEMQAWEESGSRPGFTDGDEMFLRIWDRDSETEYCADVIFDVGDGTLGDGIFTRLRVTGTEEVGVEEANPVLPVSLSLSQVYPNPFNATAILDLMLPEAADVRVGMYNVIGQRVAVLADGRFEAGFHKLSFDASHLSSGIYFIRAKASEEMTFVRKVVLMK
jgi:hypothetical protein